MIDAHVHVLPGLDDGPQEMMQAIRMCALAAEDGTELVVATPHVFAGGSNPSLREIRQAHEDLQRNLNLAGVAMQLRWAAEIPLLENLPELIRSGLVPFLDSTGRYILLEPPRLGDFSVAITEMIFRLQLIEITPVIAHPEHSQMFHRDSGLAERLVAQGALLQLTASTVATVVSAPDSHLCRRWLKQGLVHIVASDGHDTTLRPPCLSAAYRACEEFLGRDQADLLFKVNPARVLAGEDVVPLRALQLPKASPEKENPFERLRAWYARRLHRASHNRK